jgi:REP element-mobilizing transposase RayT
VGHVGDVELLASARDRVPDIRFLGRACRSDAHPGARHLCNRVAVLADAIQFWLASPCTTGDNLAMPRTLRASAGGYRYHDLNRGHERSRVFHHADDCHAFVASLRAGCARVPMRLVGFCVMPNHFDWVLWPYGDGDLSVWMQWLLTDHAHGYRRRYRGSDHVGQGRGRSFPIEEAEHLLTVLRYVERNPLRAARPSNLHRGRPSTSDAIR